MPFADGELVEFFHLCGRQNQRETTVGGQKFVNSVRQLLETQLSVAMFALQLAFSLWFKVAMKIRRIRDNQVKTMAIHLIHKCLQTYILKMETRFWKKRESIGISACFSNGISIHVNTINCWNILILNEFLSHAKSDDPAAATDVQDCSGGSGLRKRCQQHGVRPDFQGAALVL